MSQIDFAAAAKQNGSIQHEGQTLALEQMAYPDTDFSRVDQPLCYKAMAQDKAGNRYRIQWALKPSVAALAPEDRPDDESAYCDWDRPELIALAEAAA